MAGSIHNPLNESYYLEGQLLVATPLLAGSCFERSVIYLCAHNEQGAMGVLVNQAMDNVTCTDILNQLNIHTPHLPYSAPIHFGGPVEPARGFILHTGDYKTSDTQVVGRNVALTSTVDILRDIVRGKGPSRSIIALGYAGWGAGQLEAEITGNSWLTVPATEELIFGHDNSSKWLKSTATLGMDMCRYSSQVGHA